MNSLHHHQPHVTQAWFVDDVTAARQLTPGFSERGYNDDVIYIMSSLIMWLLAILYTILSYVITSRSDLQLTNYIAIANVNQLPGQV